MGYRDPFASAILGGQSKAVAYDVGLRAYMLKIYNYMASALVLTGVVAMVFAGMLFKDGSVTEMGMTVLAGPMKWVLALAPLGVVLALSFGINRLSTAAAQALFWTFAVLMGLSLSSLLIVYTGDSIARVFFITAGTFGAMSIYGYTTKKDLTAFGSFLMMGVIGLLIASVVNIFMGSSALQFAISVLGVLIFVGLTAYDTQKLKLMYSEVMGSSEAMAKATIMGALTLYLDFINIFIYLLRLFGERR